MMVDIGEEKGSIETTEKEMIENIFEFNNTTAEDCMIHRKDITAIDVDSTDDEVLTAIEESGRSRFPVYEDSIDNVIGLLISRDFLLNRCSAAPKPFRELVRPAYFVPETKMIDDLLRDFQTNKIHIAIVVDEFGGTSGIVTMEDIIEEIVGEINDEYDEEERSYVKINDHTYVFEAKTLLSDFYKILKIDNDVFEEVEGDADTLAGLLLEIKGEFPVLHEKLDYEKFHFEILEMDARRILKVKVIVDQVEKDS